MTPPCPDRVDAIGVDLQGEVDRHGWLVHASGYPVAGALEPRLGWNEARAWIHATDCVLFAVLHALGKRWRDQGPAMPADSGPMLTGGDYRIVLAGRRHTILRWASLHRALLGQVDLEEPVWLHLCDAGSFVRRRRGRLPSWSGGWLRSHDEWVADRPVRPLARLPIRLDQLGVSLRLHDRPLGTGRLLVDWCLATSRPSTISAQSARAAPLAETQEHEA